jgi:hypothetical protein
VSPRPTKVFNNLFIGVPARSVAAPYRPASPSREFLP